MKTFFKSYKVRLATVTIALILILVPLILKVDFVQNDDWNRNLTVQEFLKGNFRLLEVTATTFYSQGILGTIFLYIFSLQPTNLPVLTLIISGLNFFITALIYYEHYEKNFAKSVFLGLILFFFPLHFYSIIGFMTENFLLFFALLSIYAFYNIQVKNPYIKYILLTNMFWVLAFFSKQTALILPIAFISQSVFHILLTLLQNKNSRNLQDNKKNLKTAIITTVFLIMTILVYILIFPKTEIMLGEKSINLELLLDKKHVFSHFYATMAYIGLFTLPVLISFIANSYKKIHFKKFITASLVGAGFFMYLKQKFLTSAFFFKVFPYYPNTFTPQGFFTEGLKGEKILGMYQNIFPYIGPIAIAMLTVAGVLGSLLFYMQLKKKNIQILNTVFTFEFFALIMSGMLFAITPFVFDRYILLFLPIGLFYLLKIEHSLLNKHVSITILAIFLTVFSWISIDYGIEYIDRQEKIWRAAETIRQSDGEKNIQVTYAYDKYYYWKKYINNNRINVKEIANVNNEPIDYIFMFGSENNIRKYKNYEKFMKFHSKGILESSVIEVWKKKY